MFTGIKEIGKSEFREVRDKDTKIVGQTYLVECEDDCNKSLLKFRGKLYEVNSESWGITTKYIDVGDNKYIAVKSKRLLILILLSLLLLFTLPESCAQNSRNGESNTKPNINITGEDIVDYIDVQEEVEYVEVPSLYSTYDLTDKSKEVYLINPEGNSVYFKYILFIDGVEIYSTGYIQPGKMVRANLYDILDSGSYKVKAVVITIDIETYAVCDGANLSTIVNIRK